MRLIVTRRLQPLHVHLPVLVDLETGFVLPVFQRQRRQRIQPYFLAADVGIGFQLFKAAAEFFGQGDELAIFQLQETALAILEQA